MGDEKFVGLGPLLPEDTSPPRRRRQPASNPLAAASRRADSGSETPPPSDGDLATPRLSVPVPATAQQYEGRSESQRGSEVSVSDPSSPQTVQKKPAQLPTMGAADAVAHSVFLPSPSEIHTLVEKLGQAFRYFDVDESGTVSVDEIVGILQTLGSSQQPSVVVSLMSQMYGDEDKALNLREFIGFALRFHQSTELDFGLVEAGPLRKLRNVFREHRAQRTHNSQSDEQKEKGHRMAKKSREVSKDLWLPDTRNRRLWDALVLMVLFVTLSQVPWRTFVLRTEENSGGWIALDIICAVVFTVDIYVFLNTALLDEKTNRLVTSRWGILFRNSFTFCLDVVSSLPLDFIALLAGSSFAVYASFHSLRLLKVVKMPKLFRRSGRLPMDGVYVTFYFHYLPIVMSLFKFLLAIHFLVLLKIVFSRDAAGCDAKSTVKDDCGPMYRLSEASEHELGRMMEVWCTELFWVWTLLTTAPAPLPLRNTSQYVYSWVLMSIALVLQGVLVGKMSVLVLKDSVTEQAADRMRGTLAILQHYKLPVVLQQEILSYQFHAITQSAANFMESLDRLPESMQREIELYMKLETLSSVKMFRKASMPCRIYLVHALKPVLAVPDEYIISVGDFGEEMFFLVHGYADVIIPSGALVATLTSGDAFGEIALLSTDCKRTASIRALTYCDLLRLDREVFIDSLQKFPEFRTTVQVEMKNRGIGDDQRREFTRNIFGVGRADTQVPQDMDTETTKEITVGDGMFARMMAPRLCLENRLSDRRASAIDTTPPAECLGPRGSMFKRRDSFERQVPTDFVQAVAAAVQGIKSHPRARVSMPCLDNKLSQSTSVNSKDTSGSPVEGERDGHHLPPPLIPDGSAVVLAVLHECEKELELAQEELRVKSAGAEEALQDLLAALSQ
eukprot:TRINITY_DN8230_c0_g1_i1.p1 TRINITY_DN8230_c0_g1~~TRINITY_DN8230_c0_g1_i1.p1  ORF type:complete len:901 (+),score=296.26 TRINITY_DN8230_c0_g1_i1:221-2923(+)